MYIAIEAFADRADHLHTYQPGDIYPRAGFTVEKKRLLELAGSGNCTGKPLIVDVDAPCESCVIEEAPVEEKPKPTRKRAKKDD